MSNINKDKYVVVTSIFKPSAAVKALSKFKDWKLIVVADKKTPAKWNQQNVIFLSVDEQNKLPYKILKSLPWNSYSRKMVGYLFAMQNGAEIIADTDDDNKPIEDWGNIPEESEYDVINGKGFANIYKYFTKEKIWPRGFPIENINSASHFKISNDKKRVGIWQFLANGSPDVDAIYRLTINHSISFAQRRPLVLNKGVVSPFNSQNTIFYKNMFPLMYLPAFVTMRATDIFRGLIAQPIMWSNNYFLGFGKATMLQDRNPHNYLKDFTDEIPVYLNCKRVVDIATLSTGKGNSIGENLLNTYKSLIEIGITPPKEILLLQNWLDDVNKYVK